MDERKMLSNKHYKQDWPQHLSITINKLLY